MSKKFNNSYNACNWMRSTIPDLSNKSFTSRASCALTRGVRAPSVNSRMISLNWIEDYKDHRIFGTLVREITLEAKAAAINAANAANKKASL